MELDARECNSEGKNRRIRFDRRSHKLSFTCDKCVGPSRYPNEDNSKKLDVLFGVQEYSLLHIKF